MDIISHLEIEKKQIKMDSDRVFYCSVSPFTNKQFIEVMKLYKDMIQNNLDTYYLYNIHNRNLPIKLKDGEYECDEAFNNHPVCGVNWIVAKEIAKLLGGRLPYKYEMAYGVSWNNSQGENIKAYKYKWSQLGAVSVGFRVFFD